jgi:hypothetical protein
MFKNFFNKKNDGFFMQADESKPSPVKAEPAVKAEKKEPAKAADVVTSDSKASEVVVEVAAPAAKESAKAKKTSIKEKKNQDKAAEKMEKAAAATVNVAPAPTATNFATDYLIKPSSNGGRRRPGANMKSFVSMAREVKK